MKVCQKCNGTGFIVTGTLISSGYGGVTSVCPKCQDYIKFNAEIKRRFIDPPKPQTAIFLGFVGTPPDWATDVFPNMPHLPEEKNNVLQFKKRE